MNQRVAKQIRRIIYGENSRTARDYGTLPQSRQIVCRGLRENYQIAKRLYRKGKREGRTQAWIFGSLKSEAAILRLHAQGGIFDVG